MLPDQGLNIAIRDVSRIICHFRDGVFFPREILALTYSGELARLVGLVASLRSDVVIFRCLANFAPPLMQMNSFPPDVLGLLIPVRSSPNFCQSVRNKS